MKENNEIKENALYEDINLQYYGTAVFLSKHAPTAEERNTARILSILLEDMILTARTGRGMLNFGD